MGRKTSKIDPSRLGFRQPAGGGPSHGHRQHAQKLLKIARVASEISCQTDRHTDRETSLSQYFATARAGEVKSKTLIVNM